MTTTTKGTLKYLGAFLAVVVIGGGGLGLGLNALQSREDAKKEARRIRMNNFAAAECVELKGKSSQCERVNLELLDEDTKAKVLPFQEKFIADKKAAHEKFRKEAAERAAKKRKLEAEKAAKFKAEGWWEEQPGIFVRWCSKVPCPGPTSNGYSDYTWRAMVWCKERACGDIYARLNILNGGTVVGWTNDSAYGGYGQKVVLTFGSSTPGKGQLVEFVARG
nr:hypothetical protein 15 [bacterium]